MKTKQKIVLSIVVVAIVAYAIGAYFGFPLAQMGLTSGNIGKANKQQELVTSPTDVKMVEKFETDTVYLNDIIVSYGMLLVQTKATVNTVENIKGKMGQVKEFKAYETPMNEALEIGKQLSAILESGMTGLQNVADKKPVTDLSVKLCQALNMFQLMNSKLSELDGFNAIAGDLAKQKKLNGELVKLCSNFAVETAYIATSCGDNIRAINSLGALMSQESKINNTQKFLLHESVNNYIEKTDIDTPLKKKIKSGITKTAESLFSLRHVNDLKVKEYRGPDYGQSASANIFNKSQGLNLIMNLSKSIAY